jgi:hypothetical protein
MSPAAQHTTKHSTVVDSQQGNTRLSKQHPARIHRPSGAEQSIVQCAALLSKMQDALPPTSNTEQHTAAGHASAAAQALVIPLCSIANRTRAPCACRTSLKSVMVRTLKPVTRSTESLPQRAWPNTRT